MYFIEILSKIFTKREKQAVIMPEKTDMEIIAEEEQNCEHVFVPIDRTGKIFACTKCGLVIKHKPKNLNFFEDKK